MRNAGIPRQQQPLGGAHTQAHTGAITFDPWALARVVAEPARAVRQANLAQKPPLALQRTSQGAQMRLHFAIGRQIFHQHLQHPATRQANARTPVAAIAITHDRHRLGKLAKGHALKEVFLDAAARQRAHPLPCLVHRQQRARRARRRPVSGKHRAQPDPLAVARPLHRLVYDLQI
ncbi:hypothetical protein D3C73_1089250 [compost metagenome]